MATKQKWKQRTTFYKARPKNYIEKKKKPSKKFSISFDLAKRRYDLLKIVRDLLKNNPSVLYIFSDANYSLSKNFVDNSNKFVFQQ